MPAADYSDWTLPQLTRLLAVTERRERRIVAWASKEELAATREDLREITSAWVSMGGESFRVAR